jgi:hypothetical protein
MFTGRAGEAWDHNTRRMHELVSNPLVIAGLNSRLVDTTVSFLLPGWECGD